MSKSPDKKIYAFAGSFNPPHIGHINAINDIIKNGADTIHLFVRVNKELDLVDVDTKRRWFEQMIEDNREAGWDRIVLHMSESVKNTGKRYSLKVIREGIQLLDKEAGEHITHFYAGSDYKRFKPIWPIIAPKVKLVIGMRVDGLSSTAIRNDLEGNKHLLSTYVYEDLKKLYDR